MKRCRNPKSEMEPILNLEPLVKHFQAFFLVLGRTSGIFVASPFFGSMEIPVQVKAALILLLSLIIFPVVGLGLGERIPENMVHYGILVGQEVIIGLIIGFITSLIFSAFQLSGQFYSLQIGFGIVSVMDPLSQTEIPIIGQLVGLFALLIFILFGGHHLTIRALCESYTLVPVIHLSAASSLLIHIVDLAAAMFLIAMKIGLPIIGTVFLTDVSFGILSRAAPQMNIMMVGWPVKILVGLITLIIFIPLLHHATVNVFDRLFTDLRVIMQGMGK
ncbi:MAG: flagellar biosynthetic protein FliR [bacterium]|nr:flagellar biosynthetic protein FliR [bacterium]